MSAHCPKADCKKEIHEWELRSCMGKDYEEIEAFIIAHIGEGMPNIAKCSCGQIVEIVHGTVDYNQKDENMKPFSREAAECMAMNRVRCPKENCGKNFCCNS